MALHPAKCPRCGNRLEVETATDEQIVCPHCQVSLSLPGKMKPSDKADPLTGQTLGQFEILELLGRGGMGAVYKARQASLDRLVAIKVLPRAFSRDSSFIERFNREAHAAAAISHPHVIEVFDFGHDKGFQFIAMEFVDGETLADLLKREGRLAPDRAIEMMKQVAAALAEAHDKGIVHRDIKPSNILLTSRGVAKVADFGLAKRISVDVSVTATGAALGTPLYMPPEVARGNEADARADLYSLGATFYQALAGNPPFTADTPAALIAKHLEAEVPPLAQAAPDAPPQLCRIIHRLLYKKPGDRYQSAPELLDALNRLEAQLLGATHAPPLHPAVSQAEATRTLRGAAHAPAADRLQARQARQRRLILIGSLVGAAAVVLVVLLALISARGPASQSEIGNRKSEIPTPPPPATDNRKPKTPSSLLPDPPTPITEHRLPSQTPTPRPSWEAALAVPEANAKALLQDSRYAEAAVIYENLSKALDDPRLKDRAQKAMADIYAQADAAYADLETKAKKVLADKKYDDARAVLQPVLDRFGLPLKAAAARKLLAEIDAAQPEPTEDQWGEWVSLFDGKTFNGWRVPEEGNLARHGKVFVEDAALVLERGEQATGLAWTGEFPKEGYECSMELKPIVLGNAALSVIFPVGASHCDLGVASWDNAVTGLQMVDGQLANNNETTKRRGLQPGRWYQVRIRVTPRKIEAWLDADQVVDLPRAGRTLTTHPHSEPLKPFGLGQTRAMSSVRNIRLRRLKPPAEPDEKQWGEWVSLFDGKSLDGWKVPEGGGLADHGRVHVDGGRIILEPGNPGTGLAFEREFPPMDYEVVVEGMRVAGDGDFSSMVFPMEGAYCAWVIGGLPTDVLGIHTVDGRAADDNQTTRRMAFEKQRWYQLRLRVTRGRIEGWVDQQKVIDLASGGHRLGLEPLSNVAPLKPFGIYSWYGTKGAVRAIRLRRLKPLVGDSLVFTKWPFDAAEAKRRQEETAKALGVKVEQDVDLGNGVKMTFVLIPAGEFLMGSPPTTSPEKLAAAYGGEPKVYEGEFPQHRVKISRPFWMGNCEVTQEQWMAVLKTNPSGFKDKPKNPVEEVDWHQAHGFGKALSKKLGKTFRLPTEAEWEYACRAGTATEFYFGNDAAKLADFGWFGVNSTAPVGMKKPNAWGLYDMAGNVWEWVEDWYGQYEAGAQTDPKGAPAGGRRVLRGGPWNDVPGVLRSAFRGNCDPGYRGGGSGLRAVLAPEPAKPQVQPPPRTETPQPAETWAAAYAAESDKVWDFFRQRKYAEAETLLGELAKRPEFKAAAPLKADAEAAALLKDFWTAVEKGLGDAKGRFLIVGGASGSLDEAKDGVIRIRTPQGKVAEKSLTDLATKQALHYSGLKDNADPRARLLVGVFLLADGTLLDEAGKALAAAGDAPSVGLYKERLNSALAVAAEAAAEKAWLSMQDEAKGKLDPAKAARLSKSLADFAKAHGETKLYKGLGETVAALKTRIEDSLVFTEWPFDEKEAKRRQKVTADALGVKIEQDIDLGNGVKMTIVLIPAGEFLMGSPPATSPEKLAAAYGGDPKEYEGEFPQHRVKISRPFWMAKYEVTQEQWEAVMGDNPSNFTGKPQNPVERLSWEDCERFVQKLSAKLKKTFGLPTEAQWEYACRAGTATEFYFGNDPAKVGDFGWVGVNSTAPVGLKKPNAWGLFDMAGNACEWCEDWYGQYEGRPQSDPKGSPAGGLRLLRGGCWPINVGYMRSARRAALAPAYRCPVGDDGFRVVLAPGPR